MYFLDAQGNLLEGEPLSGQDKTALDYMTALFHDSVCDGYHSPYDVKCQKLAIATIRRFNVTQKADYVEPVPEPAAVEVPETEIPQPILSDNDMPF